MGEPGISTTTIAIFSFDAPGHSPLRERRALSDVAARFDAELTAPFGSGLEAVFRSASSAVGAALAARAAIGREEGCTMRIGLAAGDVYWEDARCYGSAVLTAARLAERARAGEIVLTRVVAQLVGDGRQLPINGTESLQLRGIRGPVEVERIAADAPRSAGPLPSVEEAHPVPVDGAPVHLTPREAEVLALVATGLGNRAIGQRLYISPNTVANHVRSILAKVGCDNRTEATIYALRHGLTADG